MDNILNTANDLIIFMTIVVVLLVFTYVMAVRGVNYNIDIKWQTASMVVLGIAMIILVMKFLTL